MGGCLPIGDIGYASGAASVTHTGTAVLTFASGSGNAEVTVIGEGAIAAGSRVMVYMMAVASAGANADEQSIAPIKLTAGTIVPGVGFTIRGVSEWHLSGAYQVEWIWW